MGRSKKLTPERLALYQSCFDKEAYKAAIDKVLNVARDVVSKPVRERDSLISHHFMSLYHALGKIDPASDVEYLDNTTMFRVNVEVDNLNMSTNAEYVGLDVYVGFNEESNDIWNVALLLYYGEHIDIDKGIFANPICWLNPLTYEITKWVGN